MAERGELAGALEAVLLVADQAMDHQTLARLLEAPPDQVLAQLQALAAGYDADGRGFELRHLGGGWRYYTRERYAPAVERFVLDGQRARLSQAALETLAVVAYRQPVSRGRVAAIRGVSVDGVMRTLQARGMVEEAGTEAVSGAVLYRTTGHFCERLGLSSLAELPDLAPFLPELGDLEPDVPEFVAPHAPEPAAS